jgi:hypothetical protein
VWGPNNTTGKIVFFFYISIFMFLDRRRENKRLTRMVANIPKI